MGSTSPSRPCTPARQAVRGQPPVQGYPHHLFLSHLGNTPDLPRVHFFNHTSSLEHTRITKNLPSPSKDRTHPNYIIFQLQTVNHSLQCCTVNSNTPPQRQHCQFSRFSHSPIFLENSLCFTAVSGFVNTSATLSFVPTNFKSTIFSSTRLRI